MVYVMYIVVFVVQNLQQLEERRVGKVQEYIQKSADIENDAVPIINTCIAGVVSAAKSVSPTEVNIYQSTVCFFSLEHVSIACYAERCTSYSKSVCPSVCVTRWHCVNKTHAMITGSSLEDSP